jgi:antitoxin (DNA-binding transcriptional repressor) of toxin-antitoxin stability system
VSDLKNNLSARLRTVAAGQPLLVTDHRKPVAVLYPFVGASGDGELSSLVAEGLVSPPRHQPDSEALLALPKGRGAASLAEAIVEERDAR